MEQQFEKSKVQQFEKKLEIYEVPQIEVIELELEGIIAGSSDGLRDYTGNESAW